MKRYSIQLFVLLFIVPFFAQAQHGVSYNQFGQLRNSLNSSLSTMDERGGFSTLGRGQWMDIEGAPRSLWATGHAVVSKIKLTIGADVKHASLGVTDETEMTAYVAKAVQLGEHEYLSLSMGGGFLLYKSALSKLDNSDAAFRQDIRQTAGVLSISTSYYKKDKYYLGVSMPRFSLNRSDNEEYEFRNVYYITGGVLLPLDDMLQLRPSFLVSHMDDMTPRYDVSAMLLFGRKLGLGMGVQNQGDLSGLMQLNFGSFGVGYSYQFSTNGHNLDQRISNNTHEIGLKYRVGGISLL